MVLVRIHLHTDSHEVRSGVVLDPVSQVITTLERLPACAEVWVAVVPPQGLPLGLVALSVAQVGVVGRAQLLT